MRGADRHRVEQRLEAGEDADEGEAGGRDVEPAGAVPARPPQWDSQPKLRSTTQRRASTTKPSAGRVAGDHAVAHAVTVRPFAAALGRERAVVDPLPQGRPAALPASSASSASRSCTEAGTTATASQWPSASTSATRLRPTTPLAASYPRGPRTAMHFTACVSMMASVGPGRLPPLRRRRRATSRSRASNRPSSSQRRNQPYTVRHGGQPAGRARQGPPTRRCQAIAPTTRRIGVARPLRGGSARSNHAATSSTAHAATSSFRPGSCRARCASVHIPSSAPIPTIARPLRRRHGQVGTAGRSALKQAVKTRKLFQCNRCKKQVRLTAGTVFQDTKLPLTAWFTAIYHLAQGKNGISSIELARRLGVKRQTAWLIKHKLMRAMGAREAEKPKLAGRVEVDDAYLGGERPGGKRGRGAAGKTPIVAAVETTAERRPRRLRLSVVKGFRKKEVERLAERDFAAGSNVVSDGLSCWPAVEKAGCQHFPMATGSGKRAASWAPFKWVNTCLGNIKTALAGTYHHVSAKHAQSLPHQLRLPVQPPLSARQHRRAPRLGRRTYRPAALSSRCLGCVIRPLRFLFTIRHG